MISRLFPIIPLALGIAIIALYVHPTYTGSIAELSKEINGYERALEAAQDFNERQSELTSSRSAIPTDSLSRIEAFLPNGVDNVQLYLDLDALAARSDFSLSDFDVIESAPVSDVGGQPPADMAEAPSLERPGTIDYLDISVTATGEYAAFRTFLLGVENSLRLLDVVSVSIIDSETGTGPYSYDMTFRIYWLR
jgi:hypothetical protein